MADENNPVYDPDLWWLYVNGHWERFPNPLGPYLEEHGIYEAAVKAAGYERFLRLGEDVDTLSVDVYQQQDFTNESLPRYLVWIRTVDDFKMVSVRDFANLMELLAKLTPTITAAVLTEAWSMTCDEVSELLRPTNEKIAEDLQWRRRAREQAKRNTPK